MRPADGEHAMDTEMQRIPHKVSDLPKGKREAFMHRDLLGSGKDYPQGIAQQSSSDTQLRMLVVRYRQGTLYRRQLRLELTNPGP
jgi:hypothetical protein